MRTPARFVRLAFAFVLAPNMQTFLYMVKAFATSAVAWSLLFAGGLIAIACSSTEDSTFGPDSAKPDAEDAPIGTLVPEGGLKEASPESGPASCPPAIPAAFAPTWIPPTKSAACTTEELKAYYDACLVDPSKTEADGTCAKFKTEHAACGACAEPANKSGPIQWHAQRKFYTTNTAGCIAVTQDAPEAGRCGDAYNAAVQCSRESCESCFAIGGTFAQFRACQTAVQDTGVCKTYENAQGAACTGYRNPGSPALVCFNSGSETQEVHFTRVVATLCGPGAGG